MKKRLMFLTILVLALLVAVTPVLAAGSSSQDPTQNQEQEQNQDQEQSQNQEQNQDQEQNQNQEQNQDQEQNQNQDQEQNQNQEQNQDQEQNQNQDQEQNQEQEQNQNQEQNGSGSEQQNGNQEQNGSQSQHQEKNQEKNGTGSESQHQAKNQEKHQYKLGERSGKRGQPSPLRGGRSFSLTGTIAGLGGGSLTVHVQNGNRFVKPYAGDTLEVLVTGSTAFRAYTPGGCVPIDFADLAVSNSVSIGGTVGAEGIFTAQRVTVDVPCPSCVQ